MIDQLAEKRNAILDPIVSRSWKRCLEEHALDPLSKIRQTAVFRERVRDSIEQLDDLFPICRSQIEHIHRSIISSGHAVILSDANGVIIDFLVAASLDTVFYEQGLVRGADWSETSEGTNGIGTAILEKRPVTIHRNQHYLPTNESLTCTGAPIFDSNGDILALLDISSVGRRDDPDIIAHTRAMLEMSARLISRRKFQEQFSQDWIVRFHPDPERIGLLEEGLLALDEEGKILAADNQALDHLKLTDRSLLLDSKLDELFGRTFDDVVDLHKSEHPETIGPYYARLMAPASRINKPTKRLRRNLKLKKDNNPALDNFTKDPALSAGTITKAKKLASHDIPLLISGETGVGKEIFAQAIHNESQRADKPFVAINCAALPPGLIEGELFGYRPGAFTGAHPDGFKGRLLQANGGTLFLDEIGDMPLDLQPRLLRVLETRKVTPLGSQKEHDLDLQILSASNQNLNELQAKGEFRSDLYYRLSGYEFTIPPLRERSDLDHLITQLHPGLEFSNSNHFTDQARSTMLNYTWPGNIRELKNVLQTALVLSDDTPIDLEHLKLQSQLDKSGAPNILDTSDYEKTAIRKMLQVYKNNVTKTARALGISRSTLYRKMLQLKISKHRSE